MDKLEHYWKFSEMEQHFNASQGGIRTLASGWLLASCGAVGLLLKSETNTSWLIPVGLLIILVATLACAGLSTLWVIDQLIFHRLLNSVFIVGLRLEAMDPTLPPIRSMMMKSAESKGMHRWHKFFYVVPIAAFMALSVLVLFSRRVGSTGLGIATLTRLHWVVALALIAVQGTLLGWVLYKAGALSFEERAAMFKDEDFSKMVHNGSFETVIARYRGLEIQRPDLAADAEKSAD